MGNGIKGMKACIYYFLVLLILICGCRVVEVQSLWPPTEVRIDGQSYDWKKQSLITLMNKNIGIGVQNDSENLYIIFALRNRMWANLMQRNGVFLWLDGSSERKRDFGLRYIGRIHIVEVPKEEGNKVPAINPPDRKSDIYFTINDYLMVIDRVNNRAEKVMPDGSSGPAANFSLPSVNNPEYMYEFSIPLKKTDSVSYGIGVKPGQTISLGLEWGGMDELTLERMRQMAAMGLDPSTVRIPPSRIVWLKVRLASEER